MEEKNQTQIDLEAKVAELESKVAELEKENAKIKSELKEEKDCRSRNFDRWQEEEDKVRAMRLILVAVTKQKFLDFQQVFEDIGK